MEYSYKDYRMLVLVLRNNEYKFAGYCNCDTDDRCVVLRHDIDMSLEKAEKIANLEHQLEIKSTYFIMIKSPLYNPHSYESLKIIDKIINYGHEIGLHYYNDQIDTNTEDYKDKMTDDIENELKVFEMELGYRPLSFSFHRPSKKILDLNIHIENTINTYSSKFFHDYKYISDSRMHWRENVIDAIKSGDYPKIQLLTHPVWYDEKHRTLKKALEDYIKLKNRVMIDALSSNIKDFYDISVNDHYIDNI